LKSQKDVQRRSTTTIQFWVRSVSSLRSDWVGAVRTSTLKTDPKRESPMLI